ncbi:MAG TPA: DNA-binding protein [Acinetobacter sp.]|nr:DNA-binding protein [Acinetobacter sp.]
MLNPHMVALIDAMNDKPIAFNRHYVALGCGINGALMLSQMVYWSKRTKDRNGFFYKTQDEWEEETGLGRREQETARKKLRELGFVSEQKRGVPCKVHFKVEHDALYAALIQYAQNSQSSMAESAKLECTNPPNSNGGKRQTNTENTAETTSENTNIYKQKFNFADALVSQGADQKLISEYMEVRKAKKAVNSETAFKSLISEQQKSGLTLNQVLEHCVVNSWKGFMAEWVKNQNQNQSTQPKAHRFGQGFAQPQMKDVN